MSKFDKADKTSRRVETREGWMSVLACANAQHLRRLWAELEKTPEFSFLRRPDVGLVMTRGRAGATGAPFNLGEATATRCSIRLAEGPEGHAYILGRDVEKAEIAAVCDALLQTEAASEIRARILEPLVAAAETRRAEAAARAEGTRVEFFTMVRGESE